MQVIPQELTPTQFADSLALRAKQLRFRGVGDQFSFLDGIGIIPIQEFLYRGANVIDLAETLNIPITVIHRWIESRGYQQEIDNASQVSAEGYIYQGEKLLKSAATKFDLDKAKAMLEHGRFMASKKDKKQYGNTTEQGLPTAGVTYVFNVGNVTQAKEIIEGEVVRPEEDNAAPLVTLAMEFNLDKAAPSTSPLGKPNVTTGIKAVEADAVPAKERIAEYDRW